MKYMALFFVFLISSVAIAGDFPFTVGPMTPTQQEKLYKPILLNKLCAQVDIQEWRSTPGYEDFTAPSEQTINIIQEICQLSVLKFEEFITQYDYILSNNRQNFIQHLALMPADIHHYGTSIRNLNDINYRFNGRSKELDINGNVIPIWGYHQRSTSYVYIRNDVLNSSFKKILAHEFFHALSYQYGVFTQHADPNKDDEILARKFTQFLQLG
jgi:hypothetical protein